jgi:hypothetical protein
MRKIDSTSKVDIQDADFRHPVKNAGPGMCADGELAANVQAFGGCGRNGVEDDRANGRGASLEELRDSRIHPQRHDALGLPARDGVDIDRQFTHASVHTNAKQGRVIDGTVPREIVLDEIQKELDFRYTFDVGAMNLEVNSRRRDDVGNDCSAVVGRTEELERRKMREWNGREELGRSVVQRKGFLKYGLVNEVEVLQTRHAFECGQYLGDGWSWRASAPTMARNRFWLASVLELTEESTH